MNWKSKDWVLSRPLADRPTTPWQERYLQIWSDWEFLGGRTRLAAAVYWTYLPPLKGIQADPLVRR